jgi:hypothetical protein
MEKHHPDFTVAGTEPDGRPGQLVAGFADQVQGLQ